MIDTDEKAPGVIRAKALGIVHGKYWETYLAPNLHIIFDMTKDEKVFAELCEVSPLHTIIIPCSVASLLIRLLQEDITYMKRIRSGVHHESLTFDSFEEGMNEESNIDFFSNYTSEMNGVSIADAIGKPTFESGLEVVEPKELFFNGQGQKVDAFAVFKNRTEMRNLMHELERAKSIIRKLESTYRFDNIHGQSKEIRLSIEQAKLAAKNDMPVLLRGEVGSGKELFAHAIHSEANRNVKKFIRINCAAIHPDMVEKKLFGQSVNQNNHLRIKESMFLEAEQGTLFIDEITDLSIAVQEKVLHYINEGLIYPIGSKNPIRSSVKLIAATSKNLEKEMNNGLFSEELYYVLNRITIQVPSLRTRKEDIMSIVHHLLLKLNQKFGMRINHITTEAEEWLKQYDWPGNIRELENVLSRAMIYMDRGEVNLELQDLMKSVFGSKRKVKEAELAEESTLASLMSDYERTILETALCENNGNKALTASRLGISLRSLYYKLEKLSLV